MFDYSCDELSACYLNLPDELPAGLKRSERTLEPVLIIEVSNGLFVASLCGVRRSKGKEIRVKAASLIHNWVVDDDVIRPLPRDIGSVINELFGKFNLIGLSFVDVLAIVRTDQDVVRIDLAPEVLVPASEVAASLNEAGDIPGLKATLFPYQAHGVSWMHKTIEHTGGLILADEMGLGKTIQIISLLLLSPPSHDKPALIVCPTSLISNWRREIFNFAPEISVMVHRGANRAGTFRGLQSAQVVITTYDTAVNDIAIMSAFEWGWVICDEAQAIKNPDSNRRSALSSIPRKRSIPMTGTPVENSLLDLWSLADFAIPSLLGTKQDFERRYPDTEEGAKALNLVTSPVVLKRRIADVAGDLPERIDIDLPIELGDALISEYERVREEAIEKYPVAGSLVATGQLQIFCAHPWLQSYKTDSEFWEDDVTIDNHSFLPLITPKLELTISLIKEAFSSERKVLVFALFNRCADLIRDAIGEDSNVYWEAINGATPQEKRQKIIDNFTEHKGDACLFLNPRAAGAGLNITAATVVIHFTQVWNPALEAQASARAHRRGQTLPVTIYRLYYENTVESVMIERSQWKRTLGNEAVPITTRDKSDLKRALEISPRKYDE